MMQEPQPSRSKQVEPRPFVIIFSKGRKESIISKIAFIIMVQDTVIFNVSGEKFQVLKELFDMYPETMLAKSVAEHWRDPDSQEEIFLDRCPLLFRHVLACLRDKKTHLPLTLSKSALLSELEYFCVSNVNDFTIDDPLSGPEVGKVTERCHCILRAARKGLTQTVRSSWTADYLIGHYIEAGATGVCNVDIGKMAKASPGRPRYWSIEIEGTNEILKKVGLKVSSKYVKGEPTQYQVSAL